MTGSSHSYRGFESTAGEPMLAQRQVPSYSEENFLSGGQANERGAGRAPAGGDPRGRCRRLLAPDGAGRGRHARRVEGNPARTRRSEDRRVSRPHRQDHRRRHAGRVRQRRRCGALRGRGAARRWPSAMPTCRPNKRIEFRIGINLGDIIVEDDDIFGDGVNIAARLEALGRAGRHLRRRRGARPGARQARLRLRGSRRAAAQEHRPAGARLSRPLGGRSSAAPAPQPQPLAAARQAVDRGAAVPEHERRPGAGVFRRRHRRGHHHRAVAHSVAVRDRPQFELHLQGPGRRHEAGRRASSACATCSKAACARPATGCASPAS